MIQDGYCFLYMRDALTSDFIPPYTLGVCYKEKDLVDFRGKVYEYTKNGKIKDCGGYNQIFDGFYELIMEKFKKVETMQKEKKYTDAEVLAILIEELDKKCIANSKMYKSFDGKCPSYGIKTPFRTSICLWRDYAKIDLKNSTKIIHIYYEEPQSINRILALVDEALGVPKQEEKHKFKVGDKVKVLREGSCKNFVGNILEIGKNDNFDTVAIRGDGISICIVKLNEIEPVVEEYEPITPDNIAEVLKYNGINNFKIESTDSGMAIYFLDISGMRISAIRFDHSKWLEHIELDTGKLKPLPKKKEQTLEEALIELEFKKIGVSHYIHGNIRVNISTDFLINFRRAYVSYKYNETTKELTYTTKEQLAKDIAAFEEKHKTRPHWVLVDDGGHGKEIGRIYEDALFDSHYNFSYLAGKILKWEKGILVLPRYEKEQKKDYGIILENGSLIKAFWKGEEV